MQTSLQQSVSLDEQAIFRKIGWRLVPFLFLCYVIAMMDRLNVGFAKLQFISDLHLNEAIYGLAAGFLYFGYILFEVPSNLMLHRLGVRKTLLRIMLLWGVFTIALAFASTKLEFYALRFLVGAAEAGFFPGVLFYFTYWFPERMRGRVTSLFVMALPVSGIIGGPVAAWIMTDFDQAGGMRGWQHLFILEGIPALVLGVLAYFYLANRPEEASWLSDEEKQVVKKIVNPDSGALAPRGPSRMREALGDKVVYTLAICYFAFYCVENALLLWIPTLLKSVGVSSLMNIGWLSGGISVLATAGMLTVSFSSDRLLERRWHVIGCGIVSALSFMLLPFGAHNIAITVILLILASAAVFGFLALFWTIPGAYFKDQAAAGGIALISSVGAIGGAVSPVFIGWVREMTGSYYYALGTLGACFLASLILLYFSIPHPRAGRQA
ncbi:MFS transporter [Undibacterium terreum]|uniref:MFS transporter n=1 Tax=Undibacterium terreum TaxID=1224302 RepID=A0A916XFH8_9BURK|nr:MFS transporter [Undibacterium terreum]GGC69594.1 MFS transporter [Undibacterium terreum]